MAKMNEKKNDVQDCNNKDEDLHYVTAIDQLKDGERVLVEVNEVEVAVFRAADEFYAVANYCPHQAGPLCNGPMSGDYSAERSEDGWELKFGREGETISCPWHGWEFDIKTGDHIAHSGTRAITYDTVVKDGQIYIDY